jgi:hypothetical protein
MAVKPSKKTVRPTAAEKKAANKLQGGLSEMDRKRANQAANRRVVQLESFGQTERLDKFRRSEHIGDIFFIESVRTVTSEYGRSWLFTVLWRERPGAEEQRLSMFAEYNEGEGTYGELANAVIAARKAAAENKQPAPIFGPFIIAEVENSQFLTTRYATQEELDDAGFVPF